MRLLLDTGALGQICHPLWATARNGGAITAPPAALDGDALLAAQALDEDATIVTTNAKQFEALGAAAVE